MENLFAIFAEPRSSVRHEAFALCCADRLAKVGQARLTEFACPALGRIERNNVVAGNKGGDTLANLHHDPGTLMSQDGRKNTLRVRAGQGVGVGVTNPAGRNLDQDLTWFWSIKIDFFNFQGAFGFPCNGGYRFHVVFPLAGAKACLASDPKGLSSP